MQATALLMVLVSARASDMNRSMPTINATPATGRSGITANVATSATKPLPVTPGRTLRREQHQPEHRADLSPTTAWMSQAWAMNIEASVR